MKPNPILTFVIILALASLACTINVNVPDVNFRAGPTQTFEVSETPPDSPAQLVIGMGAGKLSISGGSDKFVSGTIRYNVDSFKPDIHRSGNELRIEQDESSFPSAIGEDRINDWNLKLGSTPVELTINAGAYEGVLDLSGVPVTRLEFNDGAGSNAVKFTSPNPKKMELLAYNTGASHVELVGLGYANFEKMTFKGGAGDFSLDFSGALQDNAQVDISGGAATFKVIIPQGMRARISIEGGLNNINPTGTWTVTDNVYETEGEGPLLSITVDMGLGNLDLVHK